eukprot:TRINITY_DN5721_c0_g1_i12.p1 TRINITY_DN5721_c0_g1~~TRINITY_DN5721_c0_g1_i12.p1  ORF type:complete len:500 (-),score=128.88 TRINITY_DN5721_c0_g1_i12:746-2245(-)
MSDFNVWGYIARLGSRVLGPGDPTLRSGDEVCAVNEPIVLVLQDVEEFLHQEYAEFQCSAPGCREMFSQVYESEAHYRAVHVFSCSVCRKSLPSNHLLDLHIQEGHDSFFSAMAEKKASFQCFLPTCSTKFWTPEERRDHAITSHDFPSNFRFDGAKSASHNHKHGSNTRRQQNKRQKARSMSMKETRMDIDSSISESHPVSTSSKKESKQQSSYKSNNNLNKVTKNGSSETTDNNSMEVDTSETSTTTSVVMRRNKNESGGGGSKSGGNTSSTPNRRPISLARLPSPKLDTPSILNRPTSSSVGGCSGGGGGRRNTISSPRTAEKEANGNSLTSTSPRYNASNAGIESALNANVVIPPLKLDSEGNTRSRRSTISSSPRGGGGPYVSYGNSSTSPKSLQTSPRPAASINNISLEGGGCESAANSPRKSKIPVLRSASTSKAPKQFSFGVGIAKAFNRGKAKAWYQQQSKGSQQGRNSQQQVDIGTSDFTSLMDSLPNS